MEDGVGRLEPNVPSPEQGWFFRQTAWLHQPSANLLVVFLTPENQ